ncbi:XrtN system VIT domain-containing protein [Flavobacterium hungaricum]|uniref:XrtN system VIT domain-containing protein n=1 Tax=Flavobacterium hungaricum TaxID=2082725 RepID=A0ABR9TKN3_9FLAO|nr:XrtN system VIT domain-containing protein [Flavobacterium hungaricum]MBE8725900.1 XrtN system VIT domain-containing protein [Flavobacterium hungaricum]
METNQLNRFWNDKAGVKFSLLISLFSITLLISSLIASKLDSETFEKSSLINILVQVPYGLFVTFKVLRNLQKYQHLIPFLFLNWFIGCFSLNFQMNIFENLPIWVYLLTFIFCITNFSIYNKVESRLLNKASYFLNGCSILLILYYAVFLIPISIFSLFGIIVLGLGFYGLVPAIVFIIHSLVLIKQFSLDKKDFLPFCSGLLVIASGFLIFTMFLSTESKKINNSGITKIFDNNDDLPSYIRISQNLKPNFFNEILLKKDIVYMATDNFFSLKGFDGFRRNIQYNERKTHDPFLNLAFYFIEENNLSTDDQINILRSNFDKRLEAEEYLWSGKDLITKNIKEDVKIYPNDRLAYTELTIDVACEKDSWGEKEAIYSFQLPEGSVATSLSLWVNGIERKGVLTTKEKAKAAYNKIVGEEARDPSLMQWKEGNRVTVRIFPITEDLPRTFKCGFTTPLKAKNNILTYESLSIKGPNINNASTVSRIQTNDKTAFKATKDFELSDTYYINTTTGLEKWQAEVAVKPKNASSSFIWKNKNYETKPLVREKVVFTPSEIIMDLNNEWEISEIEQILHLKNKTYFVFNNGIKQEINLSNYRELFYDLKKLNYSLLPLFDLKNNSLVITKCGNFSPNFEELETSKYLQKIKTSVKDKNIKVINISENVNPFWQTIKEQRYVSYFQTDINNSKALIANNYFIKFKTEHNSINLETAGISIHENPETNQTSLKGSNHLYRMFCFGKVLNDQIRIQNDSLAQNQYVELAKDANIVTPISSLLVLETDRDYEDNGIEKNIDTLGNASINNDGAVPEPYEWAMIIIGLTIILMYYRKQKAIS